MIAKGTTHNNGAKLAQYMITGKDGERAELWQLSGFEAANIKDAFRNVQIMAEGTKCTQPFFHVQVRNREGETLTRQQWEHAANRIEDMLGLTNQPRAIAFHTNEKTGHEHMHIAWSRIDENTLTAKPLPFFKDRLKKISRELELHFGLEPVTSERRGTIKYAPTRAQEEQARRLGLDVHEIRNGIRECWDRSDSGRSFEVALADKGLRLAQGERRDFIVIDREGGMHALGKRILGVSAAQIRERMSDLSRDHLPTVEQARESIRDVSRDRKKEAKAPSWDRDREERLWQDAVIKAAIVKEKTERQFIDPEKKKKERRGSREERKWPAMPPQTHRTDPMTFGRAADQVGQDNRPEIAKGMTGRIRNLWRESDTPKAFAAALDDKGIGLAKVTKQEAERSQKEAESAKAAGRYAPAFREGEIVAVTAPRLEYQRDGGIVASRSVHRLDPAMAKTFIAALGRNPKLQGIDATKLALRDKAQQRSLTWEATRLENATRTGRIRPPKAGKAIKAAGRAAGAPLRSAGKALNVVANLLESLLAPKLTPEQIRQGERARDKREAEAEMSIDFAKYTSGLAQERRVREQEREAARQRERERDGRDR